MCGMQQLTQSYKKPFTTKNSLLSQLCNFVLYLYMCKNTFVINYKYLKLLNGGKHLVISYAQRKISLETLRLTTMTTHN